MYQTLTVGKSTTLDNVDTFTLIDVFPPSGNTRRSTPVARFQHDPRLIDTARTYAVDNGLTFPSEEQDSSPEGSRLRSDSRSDDSPSDKAALSPTRSSTKTNSVKLLTTARSADSLGSVNYRFAPKQTPTNGS